MCHGQSMDVVRFYIALDTTAIAVSRTPPSRLELANRPPCRATIRLHQIKKSAWPRQYKSRPDLGTQATLISQPVTFDTREVKGLVVAQMELGPVCREQVVAPEAFPLELVVFGRVFGACGSGRPQRQVHRVHVPWAGPFSLDVQITGRQGGGIDELSLCSSGIDIRSLETRMAKTPAAPESMFHDLLYGRRRGDSRGGS